MTESWDFIGSTIATGIFSTILNLLKVLIPLMIIIELLKTYSLLEKLATKLSWFARLMGMGKDAAFPLLVGVIMGVSYGAGTIIEINKNTPLSRRDMLLIGVFMFICHGIIETTLLFGIAGANILIISLGRFLFALIVTIIAARLPWFKDPAQ